MVWWFSLHASIQQIQDSGHTQLKILLRTYSISEWWETQVLVWLGKKSNTISSILPKKIQKENNMDINLSNVFSK